MTIRILVLCVLLVGCGDYTSDLYYGSDRTPTCEELCSNVCESCHVWHSDIYFCELHCERECRWASCNYDINRFTDKCNMIFTEACEGIYCRK